MRTFIISFALAFLLPLTAYGAEVTMSLTPKVPEPFSTVALSLVSYDVDVDTSLIVWRVAGKEVKRGVGEKNLSVTVGAVGTSVPVTASVSDALGNVVVSSVSITPQGLALLWEAPESYVPPFYEGKALPAEGAKIKVTAIPNMGLAINSLSFGWYIEDSILSGSSGAGKQSALLNLDPLTDETNIRVRVRSGSGAVVEKTLSLSPHLVMPVLYSYNELLGTDFTKALIRRLELTQDITLKLEPYFLSTKGLEGSISYDWYLDGLPATPQEKYLLALHPKANSYGSRKLSIVVENAKRLLQKAQIDMELIFDTRNQ